MEAVSPRHILFVVGMHRSGTSALCAALHACGASFGSGLLGPMERVNEGGFWESREVVDLNDRLLDLVGAQWYSVSSSDLGHGWGGEEFATERARARSLLERGFGSGPLEVVKDPRLCLTLDFWMAACQELRVKASVCIMTRAPLAVCRSLERRDGFPIEYCMRLLGIYLEGIASRAPPHSMKATYEQLLADPAGLMRNLAVNLPLSVAEDALKPVVQRELNHVGSGADEVKSLPRDAVGSNYQELLAELDQSSPGQVLGSMARVLVHRGQELDRIGELHTRALATIEQRDSDIARLSAEVSRVHATIAARDEENHGLIQRLQEMGDMHSYAIGVVKERDAQLQDLNEQRDSLGEQHALALDTLRERDAQIAQLSQMLMEANSLSREAAELAVQREEQREQHLQRVLHKPVVGRLFRAVWNHETR